MVINCLIDIEVHGCENYLSPGEKVLLIDHRQKVLLFVISWHTRKSLNSWTRMTYGNRINRGIKLCHWNAGGAELRNKMGSIENVIDRYKPHVVGLSEAN